MTSQLESLSKDIDATWRAMYEARTEFYEMANAATQAHRDFLDLVLDLFSRVRENSAGIVVCLASGKLLPAVTCYRASFEASVTIRYLILHPRPEFEAQVARAHFFVRCKFLEEKAAEPDHNEIAAASAILDGMSMPLDVMAEAIRRQDCFSWTGRNFHLLCQAAFGTDRQYREHYQGLSSLTHPHAPATALVDTPEPHRVEQLARRARIELHASFDALQRAWGMRLYDPWLDTLSTAQ